MGSFFSFLYRVYAVFYPPAPPKTPDALRFGILGTAWIGSSFALVPPSISHPEVITEAIASRDLARAKKYAKKYRIPKYYGSYQELIDDPTIDAVYIPLPNALHYEWNIRALKGGKHVLVEKPSVSNAIECQALFDFHASLPEATRPVLLEAFHTRFYPAWHAFLSCIDSAAVQNVESTFTMYRGFFPLKNQIRYDYKLAGGSLLDIGTYGVTAIREKGCLAYTFIAEQDKFDDETIWW